MTQSPLISVLIPAYNCGQYIKQAIDSVFLQNYENLEIIVVDDGSEDDTKENIMKFPAVKYCWQEHQGISAARNNCIKNASGDYIAFLDADDYWLAGKLDAQLKYFNDNPKCQIVFTACDNIVEDESLKNSKMIRDEMEFWNNFKFAIQSSLIKREIFADYGNFMTQLPIKEDTEFLYRIKFYGVNVNHFIDKVYCMRRLHGKNSTFNVNFPMKSFLPFVTKYLRKTAGK